MGYSRDYKKIRILNFLFDHRQEESKGIYELQNLAGSNGTGLKNTEANEILQELVSDNLIIMMTEQRLSKKTTKMRYKITDNGIEFIIALKNCRCECQKFEIFQAFDQPTSYDPF